VALVNSERNKATSLFDKITENRSRESGLIPDSLMQNEINFNNSLAYFREKLYDETQKSNPDSGQITELEGRIFDIEQKINRLREFLEKNFRDYYRIKYEMNSVTFRSIQNTLKRNEVLLAYSLVPAEEAKEGALYLFAVSRSDFRFLKQPFRSDDMQAVTRLHDIISDPRFLSITKSEFAEYCQSATNLYGLLISPLSAFIRDKQVVIVPDGVLHYIPFESLLTSGVSVSDIHFHDLPYFLLENPVRYSYSAELLKSNKSGSANRSRLVAAFSPEYPSFSMVDGDTIRLAQIPGIYEEVNYLKRKMKTLAFAGTDATESNFRKIAGRVSVLHLATHTLINDSVPMYSRLAFYPEEPDSITNDGWLTLSDIYNLRLKAGMTVLSACHTGTGILRKGEGIMSLARGFLYAGSQSVILTLWEVEDHAATKIMKEFYRNLKFGKRKDSALRNAKIKYITGADPVHAHPHIWLSYIMIGNPEPLFKNYMTWLFPVMIVLILVLSYELFQRKRSKERMRK
jgi:CHAT domain-containing protein